MLITNDSASSQLDALSEANRHIVFDREQSRLVWRIINVHGSTERTLTTTVIISILTRNPCI
jgi:hypothetical protein